MRFLGTSITYLPLGTFSLNIDWSTETINISAKRGIVGDHKKILSLFYKTIQEVDLSNFPQMQQNFNPDNNSTIYFEAMGLTDDELNRALLNYLQNLRIENVYDMTL